MVQWLEHLLVHRTGFRSQDPHAGSGVLNGNGPHRFIGTGNIGIVVLLKKYIRGFPHKQGVGALRFQKPKTGPVPLSLPAAFLSRRKTLSHLSASACMATCLLL